MFLLGSSVWNTVLLSCVYHIINQNIVLSLFFLSILLAFPNFFDFMFVFLFMFIMFIIGRFIYFYFVFRFFFFCCHIFFCYWPCCLMSLLFSLWWLFLCTNLNCKICVNNCSSQNPPYDKEMSVDFVEFQSHSLQYTWILLISKTRGVINRRNIVAGFIDAGVVRVVVVGFGFCNEKILWILLYYN